jgi:ribosome-associated protein YbcJ (S4-like RNA binding protein)
VLIVEFHLKAEFVELDNLLKATNLAASGAPGQAVHSGRLN